MLGEVFVNREVEGLFEETHRIVGMEADLSGRVFDEDCVLVMLRDVSGQTFHSTESSLAEERC